MSPELINAIAGLWKLMFVLTALISMVVFRKPLISFFERLTRLQLKRGQTELATELTGIQVIKEVEAKTLALPEAQSETKSVAVASSEDSKDTLAKQEPKDSNGHFSAMLEAAFTSRSLVDMEEAFNKLQESQTDEDEKMANESLYYYLRYDLGDTSALSKLQNLTKAERSAPDANEALGMCYITSGDFARAGSFYELAAQGYEKQGYAKQTQKVRCVVKSADCLFKVGSHHEAYSRVMREFATVNDALAVSALYEGLASLYEQAKETELRAFALEKALEYKPNDTNLRFKAGLAYGEEEANEMALLHYQTLLQFDDKYAVALNNIGVQYGRLRISMKANAFFKKATALNETLAAANLAGNYIYAGFAEEAEQILNTAKQQSNIDPKVGSEIAHLAETKEAESKAEEKYLDVARERQRFFLSFAEAYFVTTTDHRDFEGLWFYPDGTDMTIVQSDKSVKADWERGNLECRFVGKISNRAAKIKYEYPWSSTLKNDLYGYAYLSPDGLKLHILTLGEAVDSIEVLMKI
ncbi:MAG: tetratricopeptide repeat protein [Pyrinomonadaceae bacterium]